MQRCGAEVGVRAAEPPLPLGQFKLPSPEVALIDAGGAWLLDRLCNREA